MNVSHDRPFRVIYSLFNHECLGYLFGSFIVQLNENGNLTYSHQNISSQNAPEFDTGLDEVDYQLIKYTDEMHQVSVCNKFQRKKMKSQEFFLRVFDKNTGDKILQDEIELYLETRRAKILELIKGKWLFEMGNDGEPAGKRIHIAEEKASVLFHFRRNKDNTHYFPTVKFKGQKLYFYKNNNYLLCNNPAWLVVNDTIVTFDKPINGGKLKPFFNKKFIIVPKKAEEAYFKKFVVPLIESFDVYAQGFEIKTKRLKPTPLITFSELAESSQAGGTLFSLPKEKNGGNPSKMLLELSFKYGEYTCKADKLHKVSVTVEKHDDDYSFHRIVRDVPSEKYFLEMLIGFGLPLKNSRSILPKTEAMSWLSANLNLLNEQGFVIKQHNASVKKYFVGATRFDLQITENIDWFDVMAVIRFGEFEVPFREIRKHMLNNKHEFKLPNGEIAVIPKAWTAQYSDLFAFANDREEGLKLNKIHVSLVKGLKEGNLAKVSMTRKLDRLMDFDQIDDAPLPNKFKGSLRPYQKAGYNWLEFLNQYGFGGCLADDMGLGKTVQTLTLLQSEKEKEEASTSLLIMPTSLIYNWKKEAKKFAPEMKTLNYTGTNREKKPHKFGRYDLVLTSYGITRIDTDILGQFYFNYIILDESQAIKNPKSIISKSVRELKSRRRLVLSGTPIENNALDLWSQMSFVNPGLLGSERFFKNEYQIPIEKKKDEQKTKRLNALIKPFILRREKTQVAKDLPEKVENIHYCNLSDQQRKFYDREKGAYRNKILDLISEDGLQKSQIILLQGLTRLRQIANHPVMVDESYEGDSGKTEDIRHLINTALGKKHKLLVFSQFVKHLRIIEKILKDENIVYSYLDGSVRDRKAQVEKFQNNKDVRVFLVSLKAGGLGLNLTEADYVFLLDPWWNPAIEAQAVDRAHRIGQSNKVFTYKFIARDTVEEKILELQQSKLKLAKNLITIEEYFVKSLTKDDIANLFE